MIDKRIYTSSYENSKNFPSFFNLISISGDKGKACGFNGKYLSTLAPKFTFWKEWHDNYLNKKDFNESTTFYIENYYKQVLQSLNPQQIVDHLSNNDILLCYEKTDEFCHRYIVGEWLKLNGFAVFELNEKLEEVNYPNYIKPILKKIMKKELNNQKNINL